VLDLKNGKGEVRSGSADKPDVTLELDLQHLPTLVTASLGEVQKLFFGGQLKVGGNVMASNKLTVLQAIDKNKYDEARVKRLGSAATATAGTPGAQAQPAAPKQARAGEIFAALGRRLASDANACNGAILQFNVRAPDSVWSIDFSGKPPRVEAGPAAQAATVFGIDDGDLVSLARGEADARELYQHGKLRVDGDVGHAHALAFFDKLI